MDLLIVKRIAKTRREEQVQIRLALRSFKVPLDIVVTSPEDFEWRKNFPGTIERPAAL